MDLGSILLVLALAVMVALFVARPFFERRSVAVSERERSYSSLLAERDRILDTLQELDFDHALGKIPEDEYPQRRAVLLQRGSEILRDLDAFGSESLSSDTDALLEAAIAARRARTEIDGGDQEVLPAAESKPVEQFDELEALISKRRQARPGKAAGFCPGCGSPVQADDRFCAHCGTNLV